MMNENFVTPAVAASEGSGTFGGRVATTVVSTAAPPLAPWAVATDGTREALAIASARYRVIMALPRARQCAESVLDRHDEAAAVVLALRAELCVAVSIVEAEDGVVEVEPLKLGRHHTA